MVLILDQLRFLSFGLEVGVCCWKFFVRGRWVMSLGMEHGFLSQKGSGVGRGVKEKNLNKNMTNNALDITVEIEKQSSMENTTVLGSFPPLSTWVTSSAGNAPGKSSYANVISEQFANTVYVFFLRKQVAYLVVANYVRNT
nr:hypothetical protein [Tanacetum cinerariifolium]